MTHSKRLVRIEITLMDTGALTVTGFPLNLDTSLRIMGQATGAIAKHFIQGAKDDKLDEEGNFASKIVMPINKI